MPTSEQVKKARKLLDDAEVDMGPNFSALVRAHEQYSTEELTWFLEEKDAYAAAIRHVLRERVAIE